jgi:hypothetical protein
MAPFSLSHFQPAVLNADQSLPSHKDQSQASHCTNFTLSIKSPGEVLLLGLTG